MQQDLQTLRIQFDLMKSEFTRILKVHKFSSEKAEKCAEVFALNSLEGVYSHGVNRFPKFIEYVMKGYVYPDSEPSLESRNYSLEQWNGNLGPGPLNAIFATEKAIEIASGSGIGLVAMKNTNHWMRGGTYGWMAARKGFAFIGWSNTEANMPAWGAKDFRLGNNPLVIAVPYEKEAVVLDFAMSQFSYGKLEVYLNEGKQLPFHGGFNISGDLTVSPAEILETRRVLPIGYWKGSGLSIMLDILASSLSGGYSTHEISKRGAESALSQIFIAISFESQNKGKGIRKTINDIIDNIKESDPVDPETGIKYPGENVAKLREENKKLGIPVNKKLWDKILGL